MASKGPNRGHAPSKAGDNSNETPGQKPLTTTILQEFQNLKDKFKSDDDVQEKGADSNFMKLFIYMSYYGAIIQYDGDYYSNHFKPFV